MAKHSVSDDGDPRKYYAAIPNIVLTLGLNVYELALYVYLKKVAGESGTCWQSTATIARELSIGSGTVSRTKALLAQPRATLGGKALITVTTEIQNGGNPNHAITITDIWPENMAALSRARAEKSTRSRLEGARSPGEQRVPQGNATRSSGANKEEPLKNNPEEDRRGYPFNHFAVAEYCAAFKTELPIFQAETIASNVVDSELSRAVWGDVLRTFTGNGYQKHYAGNAVDRYIQDMRKIANGKKDSPLPEQAKRIETIRDQIQREALS